MFHQENFYTLQQTINPATIANVDHPNSAMQQKLGPKFRDALMPLFKIVPGTLTLL
jgi:hypothetical protein